MKSEKQLSKAAKEFAERWQGRGYEKGDSQSFWLELLSEVYGIESPSSFIQFEEKVKVDKTNFIDGHIPSTKVLIEQKSIGKDLRKGIVQSDGSLLNPFQQAKRYVANMPLSQHPRWIVTCNFEEFLVYDMERPNGEPEQILLKNLGKEYNRLLFLVNEKSEHLRKEMEVSMKAGEIVGKIYDALLKQYADESEETLRWLNILCVRIVFCLYAEDAGIFRHDQFHDYLMRFEARDMRKALLDLFDTLKKTKEKRSKYLSDELKAFPYTNGGLFAEEIEIPPFTESLRQTLLKNASLDFDWSEISPTIFGALFESTLNPQTRRRGGMHYTSIENIHKVIDPLFLNELRKEFNTILEEKTERSRNWKLDAFQQKLSSLTFLDPACGSGNFLTETYLSLRRLENEVIRERYHGQSFLALEGNSPVKVSINQFYGIEINDFAVTVATTALWISEAQMLAETEQIINQEIDFLPLKSYTNIREGNALRMEWCEVAAHSDLPVIKTTKAYVVAPNEESTKVSEPVITYDEVKVVTSNLHFGEKENISKENKHVRYDYIMGNPPFVGARLMNNSQKEDVTFVFGKKWKNVGNLDYVSCWFKKASELMESMPNLKAALVATNSISQGEQVANLWRPLFNQYKISLDYAYRTFRWNSESTQKAHVHCVVIGFSKHNVGNSTSKLLNSPAELFEGEKIIYENGKILKAHNINAYLMDAPNVFVESRVAPLCDVPTIGIGNQPIDGSNYLFNKEEMIAFIKIEPESQKLFRPWYGAVEFITRQPRYCLWLGDCSPAELRRMPHCMRRIEMVRNLRMSSPRKSTQKLASTPTRFQVENMPNTNFIIIPKVSSEKRRYIPIGFMTPDVLVSDLVFVVPDATLYHFGVLTSNVHMAWMRAVGGRLKSDYRYSKDIVYNNFPWPAPTEQQRQKIEQTAQSILDARNLYPDSSLADLYDELTMPTELRRAHQQNDRAVMEAYGFDVKTMTESLCVGELFRLYEKLDKGEHTSA